LFPEPIFRSFYRLTGGVLRFFNVIWDGVLSGRPIQGREGADKEEPVMVAHELSDGLNYSGGEAHMSGDFIGDLSEIRLFDLVKPLVDGKKSGMVTIGGAEVRELYVEGGSIVHGRSGSVVGEDAVTTMMDLDEGRVVFNWQLSPEKRTVRMPTEELMADWAHREEEWKKTREVIASSAAMFSIVVDSGGQDRTILEKQWGVLALCNGMRSASEVAALLGRDVVEVVQTIGDMVGMGVLEKVGSVTAPKPKVRKMAGDEFFAAVETELKKVVGPIARVIMNDTLAAFDESRDAFPEDRVQAFIQTISEQIVEEQKRDAFESAVQLSLRVNY
jgi:preprotein translocase subunit SecE